MAEKFDLLVGNAENRAVAEQTNGVATADQAAPGDGQQLQVVGITISATGTAPAAGSYSATITEDPAGTPIERFKVLIPAAAFAPIIYEFKRPFKIANNKAARLSLSALGAGAVGRVELYTITRPVTV